MHRIKTIITLIIFGMLSTAQAGNLSFLPFESVSMIYETNTTDDDAEVVITAKADEGLKTFSLFNSSFKRVAYLRSGNDKKIGLQQFKLESAEPSIAEVQAGYPEGRYYFLGKGTSGQYYLGSVNLTHDIVLPPVFQPCDITIDPANALVSWSPVAGAEKYIIEIENDDLGVNLTTTLTSDVSQFRIPGDFLLNGTDYEIGLATVNAEGNVAVVECEFSTL